MALFPALYLGYIARMRRPLLVPDSQQSPISKRSFTGPQRRGLRVSHGLAAILGAALASACVEAVPVADYPDPIVSRVVDPTSAAGPEFIGRVDARTPGQWRMSWPGIRITARFRGTTVDANFDEIGFTGVDVDHPNATKEAKDLADREEPDVFSQFDLIVDGQYKSIVKLRGQKNGPADPYFTAVSNHITLATGLDPSAEHTIELVRRSESSVGITTFRGFQFSGAPGAGYLPGFAPYKRKLLFFGDSITAGYGNEGADYDCPYSPDTSNARYSWASVAGRYLNASSSLVAWSGKGLFLNFRRVNEEVLPELSKATVALNVPKGAPACDPTAAADSFLGCWNPADYAPDVIGINLGTNDSSDSYCTSPGPGLPEPETCVEECPSAETDPTGAAACKSHREQRSRDPECPLRYVDRAAAIACERREPGKAPTYVCADAFTTCVDRSCGEGATTCAADAPCRTALTACLAARPASEVGRFVDRYAAFLKRLRSEYGPTPLIIPTLGPMISNFPSGEGLGNNKSNMAKYIRTAIAASGEGNIDFLEFPTQYYYATSGCDYHPSATTDRQMAKQFADHIRRRIPTW